MRAAPLFCGTGLLGLVALPRGVVNRGVSWWNPAAGELQSWLSFRVPATVGVENKGGSSFSSRKELEVEAEGISRRGLEVEAEVIS